MGVVCGPKGRLKVLYRFENCRLDDATRVLQRAGERIPIEPKVFDLLLHLVRNSARVVTRKELLEHVWEGVTVSDGAINRCIKMARQAIGDEDPDHRIVSTVHGRGFRFAASVSVSDPSGTIWFEETRIAGRSTPVEAPKGPFVGREEPLAEIQAAWRRVLGEEARLYLIAGEAGIGKTRLAREVAAQAQADGALVLSGRSDDELAVPYQPFIEILEQFLRWCPPSSLEGLLGRSAADLAWLLPEIETLVPLAQRARQDDAATQRYRSFHAVTEWIRELSRGVPLVLIVDDLQWATKETVWMLRHVARLLGASRTLLLVTYRDTEMRNVPWLSDLLLEIRQEPGVRQLTLAGLDAESVRLLWDEEAAANGSKTCPPARLLAFCNGNPLFLQAMKGSLAEDDTRGEAGASLRLPVESVAVIQRSLRHLPESCRRILAWASVIGETFPIDLLEAASRQPSEQVAEGLDSACAARILEPMPNGAYRFAHAIVREAFYRDLGTNLRRIRHLEVAKAMEAFFAANLDPHYAALASHYGQAGETFREQAVAYAMRARGSGKRRAEH